MATDQRLKLRQIKQWTFVTSIHTDLHLPKTLAVRVNYLQIRPPAPQTMPIRIRDLADSDLRLMEQDRRATVTTEAA